MHRSPRLVRCAALAGYGGRRAFTEPLCTLPRGGDYQYGRPASRDERRGSCGLSSDEGLAIAICELWRLLPSGHTRRRRNIARDFSPVPWIEELLTGHPPSAPQSDGAGHDLEAYEGIMRVVIVGGGTGGHIYPGIAVAHELRRWDPRARIMFIGARGGLARDIVAREGYRHFEITSSGLVRRRLQEQAVAVGHTLQGFGEAIRVLRRG